MFKRREAGLAKASAGSIRLFDRSYRALAKANGKDVDADTGLNRHLAIAALGPLMVPTKSMIDAAHKAVWFDDSWAINNRRDFQQAVRAMITQAMTEDQATEG